METYLAKGVKLQYQVRGEGDPLLLVHGGMIADSFEPIADQLAASYRVITYPRRGYHGTPSREGCTMSDVVADAVALLDHLGIATAHVAGHSIGAVAALQLAIDAPNRAHTLGLLEPCVLCVPSAAEFGERTASFGELLQSGRCEEALVGMLTLVGGEDPVRRLDRTLPAGWFDRALADFRAVFSVDVASLGSWAFTRDHAATITQPSLTILGSQSAPIYVETHKLLNQWLPNAEPCIIQGATHMLHWDRPDEVAAGLLTFLNRHPMD